MPVRPTTAKNCILENLESRRLLATINIVDFGATPTDGSADGPAIQRAINSSAAGDTILFPAGVFNVSGRLTLRGDRNYIGIDGNSLDFSIPARTYGLALIANAANMTIDNLKLAGGGIEMGGGTLYRNINFTHNEITSNAAGVWSGTPGVSIRIANSNVHIDNNQFHDFRQWGAIIFHMDQGSYSGNGFCRIYQGGQLLGPLNSVSVDNNVGRHLTRMGLEIQRSGNSVTNGLSVSNNNFAEWSRPNNGSFGLSVMPEAGLNVIVRNNYIAATMVDGWGTLEGQGQRFGIGIEAGFDSGVVENNIIGGPFAHYVTSSAMEMLIQNNQFYGRPVWGAQIARWPGIHGYGTFQDINNTRNPDFNAIPASTAPNPCDPAWNGGGSGTPPPTGGGPPPPVPNPTLIPGPSDLVATADSLGRVDLSWVDNTRGESGFKIERSIRGPNGPWVQAGTVTANATRFPNTGLPSNTAFWYRVRAYGPFGFTAYSNTVKIVTKSFGPANGFGGGITPSGLGGTHSAIVPTDPPSGTSPFSDLLI